MTKKDYKLIAEVIADSYHYQTLGKTPAKTKLVRANLIDFSYRLKDKLKSDNNRFDEQKFLDACWVKQ